MKWPTKPYFFVGEYKRTRFTYLCHHHHRTYATASKCLATYDTSVHHLRIYYHRGIVPAEWNGMR